MKLKRWVMRQCNGGADKLADRLNISRLSAGVLCARGYAEQADALTFLHLSRGELASPFLLLDMQKAVKRVQKALDNGEKIAVFGDYDADGVTSTYILYDYLRSHGADCCYAVPDRSADGYGMTLPAVKRFGEQGVSLIITVDNGITAFDEVKYAAALGMDVIVTDHHECRTDNDGEQELLPSALAVVNPHRKGDPYPFKTLAGVGVVFQLVRAMDGGDYDATLQKYGDMATLGTVADVMRIAGENRSLISEGIKLIENTKNIGLRALLRATGLDNKKINANTVGFALAPRINAAGRMASALCAVELFTTADRQRADELAKALCEYNRQRQQTENETLCEAYEMLNEMGFNPERDKAIVLCKQNWNSGIIGIVCSRLVDRYGLPTILMAEENGRIKGSGRSVKGFSLYDALAAHAELLTKYGGHELAAGLSLEPKKLREFQESFVGYCAERLDSEDTRPELEVDLILSAYDMTFEQVEGLTMLEPYGNGWPQPVFAMYEAHIAEITPVGCDKHMRVILERDGTQYTAMLFGVPPADFGFTEGDQVDVAFHLEINEFRGEKNVQMILRDIRYSRTPQDIICVENELYYKFINNLPLKAGEKERIRPVREDFIAVWRYIRRNSMGKPMQVSPPCMCRHLRNDERREMPLARMLVCIAVFDEMGLICSEWLEGEDCGCVKKADAPKDQKLCRMKISTLKPDGKIDLCKSRLLASFNK